MDIRSKNAEAVAQSEDQEDELLSIVAIKGLVDFLFFLVESENGTSVDGCLRRKWCVLIKRYFARRDNLNYLLREFPSLFFP